MPALTEERVAELLEPYLRAPVVLEPTSRGSELLCLQEVQPAAPSSRPAQASAGDLYGPLVAYLDLLLRWNERTNLTAIRRPEEIVQRHFGESLFTGRCARELVRDGAALLDLGSGAGFPGVPVQLLLPSLRVTLAESQGKKVAFLREAVRVTGAGCQVWAGRAERLPGRPGYDCVMMRAVDDRPVALAVAWECLRAGGVLVEVAFGDAPGVFGSGTAQVRLPGLQANWVRITPKPSLFHVEQGS